MNDSNTTQPDNSNDAWQPCSQGQLQQLATDLNTRERNQQVSTVAGRAMVGLSLLIAIGSITYFSIQPMQAGSLSCKDCQQHFGEYQQYLTQVGHTKHGAPEVHVAPPQVKVLSAELANAIKLHLHNCDYCREKFEQLYPGLLTCNIAVPGEPVFQQVGFSFVMQFSVHRSDSPSL